MNYREIVINTKDLPAPEPMGVILNNLHKIEEGIYIKMEHRFAPKMLLPILKKNGFDYLVNEKGDEDFEIFIFLKKERDLKEYFEKEML